MTLALFLLRAYQMGLRFSDLEELEAGTIYDMMTEAGNDEYKYPVLASQSDMDKF